MEAYTVLKDPEFKISLYCTCKKPKRKNNPFAQICNVLLIVTQEALPSSHQEQD